MEENIEYDELVQLLQNGEITNVEFLMSGNDKEDFLFFLKDHHLEKNEENAIKFMQEMDNVVTNSQDYGF